jgi:hypothetical protein
MCVQTLGSESTVKALDVRVLHRFPGMDEVELHAAAFLGSLVTVRLTLGMTSD